MSTKQAIFGTRLVLRLGMLAAMGIICAPAASAQTIDDPVTTIRAMTPAEIDASMAEIAQQTTSAAPIKSDAVTTVVRALYFQKMKTLVYSVQLAEPIPPETAAKNMGRGLCKGRTVLAFMERGVVYQYSVTTPTQTYNIIFKRADCQ